MDNIEEQMQHDSCESKDSSDASPSTSPPAKKAKTAPLTPDGAVQAQQQLATPPDASLGLPDLPSPNGHSTELCSLPDDELLQVFGFLTREQLLQCRTVCRRFRQLTLHPALWRRISLWNPIRCHLGAATLRVAPCLERLTVWEPDDVVPLGTLLAASSCAVSELHVALDLMDAVLVAVVLARQADLGRLKEVSLTVTSTKVDKKSSLCRLRQLLRQLLSTQGLESIELDLDEKTAALLEAPELDPVKRAVPVPSSLRRLEYFSACKDPYLPLFLKWHAASLEVVKLRCGHPRAAPMLAAMPRLRELQCPVLKDMPALLACRELRSLYLSVSKDASLQLIFPSVAEYLRSAVATIEDLVLDYFEDEGNHSKELDYMEPQPQLRPLAAVVHRLKHLVSLDIGKPSGELLDALDGEFVPNLERLNT
ncbi:uncharacterized protein LOC117648512 [Thrips palmi]|uniref:Uncharacterized protein LOC117648512 n=1 Tax=Thrips palmi TaxID=161013 RepID=A0A6P8Z8S6_THRPL|nr:uncharacterized protein LOC117648512 [Thrips palmi]